MINTGTIGEKFADFCTDHGCDRRWVVVKGKAPVRPGTDQPVEWRKPENRYFWDQIQKIPGDGYGIILNKTGLSCVDFDKCLEDGRVVDDRIASMVHQLDSWTEISSSGNGLHVWIITDANTPNTKPGTGFEVITDGHVKVTGNSFPPAAPLPIRMVDGDALRKILGLNGTRTLAPGTRTTRPDEKIPEGQRNNELFRMAARLRSNGMSEAGIRAALLEENRIRCVPPLPDDEVIRIAGSAGQYPPGKPPVPAITTTTRIDPSGNVTVTTTAGERISLTELAAAERFVEKIAGECLFNVSTGKWHVWNGKVWKPDNRNHVRNRCRHFVKGLYADIAGIDGRGERSAYLSDVEKLNTKRGIENITGLAGIQLTRLSEDFDANPHVLNVQNGTLEFTGSGVVFREHRKEDMCSFIAGCAYDPTAPVPEIWTRHVTLVASEDPELAKTVQSVFGYLLDGSNPLEKILVCYGAGRNGKSVTLRTIARVLGNYAVSVNPLTLMSDGNRTTSPERLKMRNVRLIVAQEPANPSENPNKADKTTLDAGFLKSASGKDTIAARGLYSNDVQEFTVMGLICLSTNTLPTVNDRSVAFWDRLTLLPFDHYFRPEERDPKIEEKFSAVLPGILNWLIEGWDTYRKTGTIPLCPTILQVLTEYRNTDDEYAGFVADCIEDVKGAETPGDDLYTEYESWTRSRHNTPKPVQMFGRDMASRYSKKRKKTGIVYCDIRIRSGQQQVSA